MHDTICEAIENNQLLEIEYDGEKRIVEPHIYGAGRNGLDYLRAFQVDGFSESGGLPEWRIFKLEKMNDAEIQEESFEPRDDFNPDDPAIIDVYCIV